MEIQRSEWYFGLECKNCRATVYFSHDPSKGLMEIPAHEDSVIKLSCPECGAVENYDRSDLISREVV